MLEDLGPRLAKGMAALLHTVLGRRSVKHAAIPPLTPQAGSFKFNSRMRSFGEIVVIHAIA